MKRNNTIDENKTRMIMLLVGATLLAYGVSPDRAAHYLQYIKNKTNMKIYLIKDQTEMTFYCTANDEEDALKKFYRYASPKGLKFKSIELVKCDAVIY